MRLSMKYILQRRHSFAQTEQFAEDLKENIEKFYKLQYLQNGM